jgi:putative ABC transport system substrate-binding protein
MAELIAGKVDIIVAADAGSSQAAKLATKTIPIVAITGDPVREKLVNSLARPGGNITGFATFGALSGGKRLEILHEIIPRLARVGVLDEPDHVGSSVALADLQDAARRLSVTLHVEHVRAPNDLPQRSPRWLRHASKPW